jgi:hypothetical protein
MPLVGQGQIHIVYDGVELEILGSFLVFLTPSASSSRMGVTSKPAYVVEMHMCGKPVRMLMTLSSPIVLPPPMEIMASALTVWA